MGELARDHPADGRPDLLGALAVDLADCAEDVLAELLKVAATAALDQGTDPLAELEGVKVTIDARLQPDVGPLAQSLTEAVGQRVRSGADHRGDSAVETDLLDH
eukprot:9517651-Alexandrium_andersonii.AAC.1